MITVHTRRQLAFHAMQVADLIVFCAVLSYALHIGTSPIDIRNLQPTWGLFGWLVATLIVWHLSLVSANMYRSHRIVGGFPAVEILRGVSMGAIGTGALAFLFQPSLIRLDVIVHVWWMSGLSIVALRSLLRYSLISVRNAGRNLHFVLVIGSGNRSVDLIKRMCEPATGYRVIGYVDDSEESKLRNLNGVEYLGTTTTLPGILAERVVDEVFMLLPMRSHYDSMAQVIGHCEEQGIPVRIPIDLFVPGTCTQHVDVVEGMPVLSLVPSDAPTWYVVIKRIIDVSVAVVLLILLFPLFFWVALLVKLESPGPVFFVQKRVGLHKRPFPMIKFRTMSANGEAMLARIEHLNEADGPVFKMRDDPRVTRYGRFLRRSSIDELPQLVNVLFGHMSLVGPRPLPLRDVEGFKLNWQRRRFSVRPGMTCLWQIGGRSAISFDQWMELDMYYIEHRNLLLDLKILVKTVPVVLKRAGAY